MGDTTAIPKEPEVCNAEIEQQYAAIPPRWDAPDDLPALPPVKPGSKSKN